MQFIRKSPAIDFNPDPVDGALNAGQLIFTKARIGEYGAKARFFGFQIKDDQKLTITRFTDRKGLEITESELTISLDNLFQKTANFSYCTRGTSTNRSCNIIQQNSGGSVQLWALVQFSFNESRKVTENLINHPGDASYIKFFTRYKKHLYYLIVDASLNETINYVDISFYNPSETILAPSWSMAVTANKTDMHAGEDYFYVMTEGGGGAQELQIYEHDVSGPTLDQTITGIFTTDSYDNWPVQMGEISSNKNRQLFDIYVRKKGTQFYRVKDGETALLTDTLDIDTTNLRLNVYGLTVVFSTDYTQTAGSQDKFFDDWYINNNILNLDADLSGVVSFLLEQVGVIDYDLTEIVGIQCRGFSINGQTNEEVLEELKVIYDFSLPLISGIITAKKITGDTVPFDIPSGEMGWGINNPAQTVLRRTKQIDDKQYPKEVTVKFLDTNDNYQPASAVLRPQDSRSNEAITIDVSNHSLSQDIADEIAQRVFSQWFVEIETFYFTVTLKWINEVQPGNLIRTTYEGEEYIIRVNRTILKDASIEAIGVLNYV